MEAFKVFFNNKGNASILYDSNVFRFLRKNKRGTVWRCAQKSCNVSITTDKELKSLVKGLTNEHIHESINVNAELQNIKQICKRNAVNEVYENPSKIICKEISNAGNNETVSSNFLSSLKRTIYREQRKIRPSQPNSQEDTFNKLKNTDFQTTNGEDFVYLFNNEKMIFITCKLNLCFLANETDVVFVDGTKELCPKSFHQQYTIHGLVQGHYIPLVFCFLPFYNKKYYEAMWTVLKHLCSEIGKCEFNPPLLILDVEWNSHYTVKTMFPTTIIKICRFYIKREWDRKINSNNVLSRAYNSQIESKLTKYLKLFGGLLYLPPELVHRAFLEITAEAPKCDQFVQFSDYVFHNYVKGDAVFPPSLWAGAPNDTSRTTHFAEMHYQLLRKEFNTSHPNIFQMVCMKNCITFYRTSKIIFTFILDKCFTTTSRFNRISNPSNS